ncbi:MAG: phospholipid carrier-dependent glycosyltransferase [Anaerolineae bacterium]|nr:phospholipid carrier-dependent glycosyltransferase [Anaerolineae bacterium]
MGEAPRVSRWLIGVDILWVSALMIYVLFGMALVPFHADESTQIMMSRDYYYQFVAGDWDQVRFQDPPLDATEQHLRLLNGTVSKLLYGLAWDAAGFTVDDLNEQWLWGADYAWNVENGHRPAPGLLLAARWAAALPSALAVLALFGVARLWGGRWAAYPASFLLATHGAALIHMRRAYMEATLLLFGLLVVLVALAWASRLTRPQPASTRSWGYALLLALASGLAVASKHSGAVIVAAVYAALLVIAVWRRFPRWWAATGWFVISGVLALGVFLAANPAWWDDPLARAGDVLALRQGLVSDQAAAFPEDVYPDLPARLEGMIGHLSTTPPEYFEVSGWEAHIGAEIAAYESSPWAGFRYGQGQAGELGGMLLLGVAASGALILIGQVRERPALLVLALWGAAMILFVWLTIPLNWQRYIMPLYPIQALLAGGAVGWLLQRLDPMQ